MRKEGKWILAKDFESFDRGLDSVDKVYCFVLDKGHIALVNGHECLTWGHDLEDPVTKNYYPNSHPIVQEL